jgi:long-chain acyl-CoA synthetase
MDYKEYKILSDEYYRKFRTWNAIKNAYLKLYFKLYHRLEITGRGNIPEGPALIVPNHGGGYDLDSVSLSHFGGGERKITTLYAESWHFINSAWGRYFTGSGLPLRISGGIQWDYLDPYLKPGGENYPGLIAIFPEGNSGTFAKRKLLGKFFPGAVRIALRYKVPIVPTAAIGFHLASPILREIYLNEKMPDIIPFPVTFPWKLRIIFGRPFELTEYYGRDLSREEEFRIANDLVRPKVLELMNRYGKFSLADN